MSMDIEDLNKSQIILLTLLVSFVTSIATGIVTVSLMEKAPKDVVRVTQKVVERVVEKVEETNPIKKEEPVKEKIIEKTVVVKEGDLIAQAIAENRSKLFSIYDANSGEFLAFAFPYEGKYLISDFTIYKDGSKYYAENFEGERLDLEFAAGGGARSLAKFAILQDGLANTSIKISEGVPRLGQSVFMFTSPGFDSVSQRIISKIAQASVFIDASGTPLPGSLIFNSKGELVGISTASSRSIASNAFVTASILKAFAAGADNTLPETSESDENSDDQENQGAGSDSADSAQYPNSNAENASKDVSENQNMQAATAEALEN